MSSQASTGPSAGEHYFTADPSAPPRRRRVRVRLAGVAGGEPVELETAAGVFSGERLDAGTAVLLGAVGEPPASGALLDLGCGWGPIALSLAARSPGADVWAVDVNARARDLTGDNAARLGLGRVRTAGPDGVPDDVEFAEIWSNPPIRVGKEALHALLLRWLPRLAPGGAAHLVVARDLGADSLQRWLGEQGWPAERAASAKGYRVLRVTR